jgi:hypothetical protein
MTRIAVVFILVVQTLLVILKFIGIINWSWVWVLSPYFIVSFISTVIFIGILWDAPRLFDDGIKFIDRMFKSY